MENENESNLKYYPSPMQQYGSSIQQMTNPDVVLKNMELAFRGKALDENGNPIPVGERLMNEHGINSISGQVRSLMNQVAIMSNFNDVKVSRLMERLYDTLIKDLMVNKRNYDIQLPMARDKIITIATNSAYIALSRALAEGDRRFWKGSQQEITYRTQDGNEKKGTWATAFGKLM